MAWGGHLFSNSWRAFFDCAGHGTARNAKFPRQLIRSKGELIMATNGNCAAHQRFRSLADSLAFPRRRGRGFHRHHSPISSISQVSKESKGEVMRKLISFACALVVSACWLSTSCNIRPGRGHIRKHQRNRDGSAGWCPPKGECRCHRNRARNPILRRHQTTPASIA